MMQIIADWLNGRREYTAGVKLYLMYGEDRKLKRLFSEEGLSDYKKKRLEAELRGLMEGSKKEKKEETKVVARVGGEKLIESKWNKERDEIENSLYLQWKEKFVEMMDLCSRIGDVAREGLKNATKKQEAARMAFRILDLDEECDEYYRKRDFYKENKKLPDERKRGELCMDPRQIPKKLLNHERYVRDYKRKLKENAADEAAAEQLKKHEWFVEEYKKILNPK